MLPMKNKTIVRITLLVLATLALSCFKVGGPNDGVGITSINLETSLPNGRWEGSGQVTTDGVETVSDTIVSIDNNQITEDFYTNGQSGIAVHKLNYTGKGVAQWLDGQSHITGECQCYTRSCHCSSDNGAGTKHQMSLSFTEKELNLEQSGEVNAVRYHNVYKLRIK